MVNPRIAGIVGWVGAIGNWTIPLAGVLNMYSVDPKKINVGMTVTLGVYSLVRPCLVSLRAF